MTSINRSGLWAVLAILTVSSHVWAGPKGQIYSRKVAPNSITIDGSFTDWPLHNYSTVAQQPLAPTGRENPSNNAKGDHIVFDFDRVGYFNGTPDCSTSDCSLTGAGVTDFGSSIYFSHDNNTLHVLAVFIDDVEQGARDTTEFGTSNFLNDGFEMFFDALNDSLDAAHERVNGPNVNFDDDRGDDITPNEDDFQVTFALNDNFPSPTGPGSIGARQHLERAGQPGLLGADENGDPYTDFTQVTGNGRNNPGGIYREALTAQGVDIAARHYNDLRAAGAPNPEIAANPGTTFSGYVLEGIVPLGFIPEFNTGHDMGFALFWRDTDEDSEPNAGGANIAWVDYTQNTRAGSGDHESPGELFVTANWAKLSFTSQADFDLDGSVDAADAGAMFSNWGRSGTGDLNNDGIVDAADAGAMFADWTGDPTAGDGAAAGEYNVVTGEIKVHANNVVNWYIQSGAGGLTGTPVGDLPGPGLVTDNNSRVGETALGKFSYEASLGNVAVPGLPEGDLVIYWNSDLGRPLQNAPVAYIPEPSGILSAIGLLGLLAARRRS